MSNHVLIDKHIPAGRVPIEDIVRFIIEELNVEPRQTHYRTMNKPKKKPTAKPSRKPVAGKNKGKKYEGKLSLYGIDPEQAIKAFMQAKPESITLADLKKKPRAK